MRILVTGKQGQVVTSIKNHELAKKHEIITLGRPEVDLSDADGLKSAIKAISPDVIISAAAYTAVDKAESDVETAHKVNAIAPEIIGSVANELEIPVIHLSTDYVFPGDKATPYTESDLTGPQGVYGKTKLEGEQALSKATNNHIILRTAWVYSPYGNNFVKTMLRLGETRSELNVVSDQFGCPTYAPEIARACLLIAQAVKEKPNKSMMGTFHLTAEGSTNWSSFAKKIFSEAEKYGRTSVKVNDISTDQYPTPAKRPSNSVLSNQKLKDVFDITLDDWEKSTEECVKLLLN